MNILLLLIPLSLVMLGAAIWAFVWAVRGGQFDDLDTPALDILVDDDRPNPYKVRPAQSDADADPGTEAGVEAAPSDPARPEA